MNVYNDTTVGPDAAVLLEFQEPDPLNDSSGPPGYTPNSNFNTEPDTNVQSSNASIFSLAYYKEFFNVNTDEVVTKVKCSLIPTRSVNYFEQHIKSKPDLYGPVWICITLAFTIAIGSNLLDYFSTKDSIRWKYEFHVITKASLLVFVYAWIVPVVLWSLIKWYLASQMFVTAVELICVYGYCLASYIPLSLLWIIDSLYLQWIIMVIIIGTSGIILVSSIEPMMSSKNYSVVAGVVVLHIFFTLIVYLSFFHAKRL